MAFPESYKGRMGLVTGGGDGIGAMIARGLAEAGLTVCVQDIRQDAANAIASEIGGGAFGLGGDVSDPDSMAAAADVFRARGQPLSFLWINAGVGAGSPVLTGRRNMIEWAYNVNVLGMIWTAQSFVPLMTDETGPRHVGFTASTAALRAPEGAFPLYAATKHGSFAIAEAISGELKPKGIGTTILCPGLLNTDIWDAARARPERFGGARRQDSSIAGHWREAKNPDVMWPHIAENVARGGGYLVCATEEGTRAAFESRARDISNSIVEV